MHAEALRQFNVLVEHRRRRAESFAAAIPGVLWAVVLWGAALVVARSYTFPVARYAAHAWLTGVATATMALRISVIAALDCVMAPDPPGAAPSRLAVPTGRR